MKMADHGARDHATWAASSTARNWHCPGALALSSLAPKQRESIHAARGTACHQIAEKCLRQGLEPSAFLDTVEKTKEQDVVIDEELVASANEYVGYVRNARDAGLASGDVQLWIEERFSLADLAPPFDAGGTADAVLFYECNGMLEVIDLKNGMGVVDVRENKQLRTYALGAMLRHRGLDVHYVKVTIVQPRAPHRDGRIRSECFHVADLAEWTADLLAAMRRSKEAATEFRTVTGALSTEAWADKWLNPGACRWCPAEGFCPKLKRRVQDLAKVWFDDRDRPQIGNTPADMSPEEVGRVLDQLDMLESWASAVRALGHTMAEGGTPPVGYQLADKHGRRTWAGDDAKVVADLKTVVGLSDDEIYADPKVRTPAQIEKVLGSKRKREIENMWHQPVTGQNLVSVAKTTRPPAPSTAERYFETQS